jgi:ABC-type antimicrobial peptide transport system permease subunit
MMNVKRRRKEVAIRKINGATLKDIAWLFSKTYIVLWTVACLLASPFVYYYGHRWLSKYVFRISLDITLFAGIYLLILTLIVATIIFQILKVAKLNPAEEL